jgi:hypothetical protein
MGKVDLAAIAALVRPLPAQNNWAAWRTIQLLGQLYSQAFGTVMLTSKAYLQQAAERMLTRNRSWAGWKMRRHQDIAGLT